MLSPQLVVNLSSEASRRRLLPTVTGKTRHNIPTGPEKKKNRTTKQKAAITVRTSSPRSLHSPAARCLFYCVVEHFIPGIPRPLKPVTSVGGFFFCKTERKKEWSKVQHKLSQDTRRQRLPTKSSLHLSSPHLLSRLGQKQYLTFGCWVEIGDITSVGTISGCL